MSKESCHLYYDNKVSFSILETLVQHNKHVKADRHFFKENLEAKIICLLFMWSKDQVTYFLPKFFSAKAFEEVLHKLSVEDYTTQLELNMLESVTRLNTLK